jgi:hypothetical protein
MPDAYSIAIFPYLKTTAPTHIAAITLRSTTDTDGLPEEQATHVSTIASMLYLQGDYQIHAATYAIMPWTEPEATAQRLQHLQAIIAYCYTAPHPTLGTPFLHYEHASLLIFTPGPVTIFLVQPTDNVDHIGNNPPLVPDDRHEVQGYAGTYNFQHHFWAAKGSRLYPPVPHLSLNISQNLAADLQQFFQASVTYHALPWLLQARSNTIADRVLRAITWANKANSLTNDEQTSLVMLAVAFETLLDLPEDQKTNRLTDAIALLLGRVPRLDTWATQFYNARSAILHEGIAPQLRFAATDKKKPKDPQLYNSLLAYGREIFQLCVATLLQGAILAERAGLADKLITNQERYKTVCETLSDNTKDPAATLREIGPTLCVIETFRFVTETNSSLKTMLDATRLAAKNLLAAETVEPPLGEHLERLATTPYAPDGFDALDALLAVNEASKHAPRGEHDSPRNICLHLCDIVWKETFRHYYWTKQERQKKTTPATE